MDAGPHDPADSDEREAEVLPRLTDRVVHMLLFHELVRSEQVVRAWQVWQKARKQRPKIPLWRILAEQTDVNKERLFQVAAEVYAFEEELLTTPGTIAFVRLQARQAFSRTDWERMREFSVVPIRRSPLTSGGAHWTFASHDPSRPELSRFLHNLVGNFTLKYAPADQVSELVELAFSWRNDYLDRVRESGSTTNLGTSHPEESLLDEAALEAEINRSALINLFEAMLVEAVHQRASDIHIFPNGERKVEIHFRIDGELVNWPVDPEVHPEAFLAVAKDNSQNVDRFERDTAQDGSLQREIDGALVRFRVSILPIASAARGLRSESVVIRVLDDRVMVRDLRKIVTVEEDYRRLNWAIRQPQGMTIVTGPTGSGKSTTLVAALQQVISPRVNALTLEDPIEYVVPGVRQVRLGHKLGLEEALRYVLRHDPDIVMVGEIRDRETADLAVKLSNTGHLTFSTLHTNDAPSAVSRLYKMGIEPFLIAYAVNLVVAQRLVRLLCPACRRVDPKPDDYLLSHLGFSEEEIAHHSFYAPAREGSECPHCHGAGYMGRRGITETLVFSQDVRQLIAGSTDALDEEKLRTLAIREGMVPLRAAARELVLRGETSIAELMRVVSSDYRMPSRSAA